MNNDLISREALKEDLAKEIKTNDMGLWLKILLVIDNALTVEPQKEIVPVCKVNFDKEQLQEIVDKKIAEMIEKTQGKWIIIKSPLSNETIVKCDKCGEEFIGNDVEDYNFCPNCGAKMKQG